MQVWTEVDQPESLSGSSTGNTLIGSDTLSAAGLASSAVCASGSLPATRSLHCLWYKQKKFHEPQSCAAANSTWSIGVVILKASVHLFHTDPNIYMVTIVSVIVPVRVVAMAARKSFRRKACDSG